MFAVQALDLRTHLVAGHYDARATLSPRGCRLYEAVRDVLGVKPSRERPYIRNDDEQALDRHIHLIDDDLAAGGVIWNALMPSM